MLVDNFKSRKFYEQTESPWYPLHRRLGPRNSLDGEETRNKILHLQKIEPKFVGHLLRSLFSVLIDPGCNDDEMSNVHIEL
jgi:hypothetical protein